MDALFALQVLHARGHILRHLNQHFRLQILTFTAQEGQKVSPWKQTHTHTRETDTETRLMRDVEGAATGYCCVCGFQS